MFNFFKRKKPAEFSKEPVKNKNLIREIAISNLSIGSIYPETKPIEPELIEKMLHNITVSTPVLSLVRGVCSRIIELRSKNGPQDNDLIQEINGKFGKIENWQGYLKELSLTPYYGFTVFEKIYNHDFTLKKLVKIPRSKVKYERSTGIWYLRGETEIEMTPDKFQIAIWEGNLEYPQGKSLFSYGLAQAFEDYNDLEAKVRGIQAKYGEIIPVFGFDEMEAETEEGRKQVKTRAESVKAMTGGNVMAIPIGGNFSLKDSFFFISLSDLKIEMHKILLERLEKKIEKFIKGSVFSEGETGSYSRDSVQQIEKEKIEDDIAVFITGELKEILKYDGLILNYNTEGLYWVAELDEGETVKEELEKKKADTIAVKIETLNRTKDLGYKISKAKAAEIIGVDEADLEEVAASIGAEFSESKKKIDFYLEKTKANIETLDEFIEEKREDFTKEIFEQALRQLKKIKSIKDLKKGFSYDLSDFQNKLIIGALIGAMDEKEIEMAEFSEEVNPFKLPYDEAISAILERVPAMYTTIEPITEEIRARFTWIKKSTELETTKKLIGNLQDCLDSGKTFKEWIKSSEGVLKATGFGENGWYLNLVWRNNLHSAYNTGAYIQQEENRENKPYGLYDAIEDGRESSICKSLNGKVYPLDHEFWSTFMPPNHHNCRSKRISLSKEDLKEYGLKTSGSIPKSIEDLKGKMGDFAGNPAKGIKKAVKQKENDIDKILGILEENTGGDLTLYKSTQEAFKSVKYTGIDADFSKEIDKKLLKVVNDYPIDSVLTMNVKGLKRNGEFGSYGIGLKSSNKNKSLLELANDLTFSNVHMKNYDTAKKMHVLESTKRGSKNMAALATVEHEYGHAIDTAYALKTDSDLKERFFKWVGKEYTTREDISEINAVNNELFSSKNRLSVKIKNKLMEDYGLDKFEINIKIKEEYGTYAASDTSEFLAEAFSASRYIPVEKQTDFMKKFNTYFDKFFKEVF